MNKGLLLGGLAVAGIAAVAFASTGAAKGPAVAPGTPTPPPPTPPPPGPKLGGLKAPVKAPAPPPVSVFTWTDDCKPSLNDEVRLHLWAEQMGENQPKGQSVDQLLESGAKAFMGRCWPPPADLKVWKPFFGFMYRSSRAYLQGLVRGGHLTTEAAQKLLTDGRKDLIAQGADEIELPPYVFDPL